MCPTDRRPAGSAMNTSRKRPEKSKKEGGPRRSPTRRIAKWLGITLGAIILLLVAAILILPHLVNTGPVKREIQRVASQATGRTVTISGPLQLSLFPWIGFDARNLTLANAPGFGPGPLLSAGMLKIHVRLWPLLFHRVRVRGVTIDSAVILLQKNSAGKTNWAGLAGNPPSTAAPGKPGVEPWSITKLSIGRLAIDRARIEYRNEKTGINYILRGVTLDTGNIAPGKKFPLSLTFSLTRPRPPLRISLHLQTNAVFYPSKPGFTLENGRLQGRFASAVLGGKTTRMGASWKQIEYNRVSASARVSGLELDLDRLKARLDATALALNGKPVASGKISIQPFSPRAFLASLGRTIPGKLRGFNRADLKADFNIQKPGYFRIHNLKLALDQSIITGSLSRTTTPPGSVRPMFGFDLKVDRLNLDNYLPQSAGPAKHLTTGHGTNFLDTALPGRLLSGLNLGGKITVGNLSGFGLTVKDFSTDIRAHENRLRLQGIRARLYGGTYSGHVVITRKGEGIDLATRQKLINVRAGPLIAALSGANRLSGTTNAAVRLEGGGNSVGELIQTLKGTVIFRITRGAITGFNLEDSIRRAYALVKRRQQPAPARADKTRFVEIDAKGAIFQGMLKTDPIAARLPFLSVGGSGTIDLTRGHLDYRLLVKTLAPPPGSGIDLRGLEGITIPVHVSGYFAAIRSVPDMKKALEIRARAILKRKLGEEKKKARKQIVNRLKELLGGG